MRRVIQTLASQTAGATLPVDWRENDFKIGMGVVVSGALTYSVQHTFDDVQDPSVTPTWFNTDGLTSLTANDNGNIAFPVAAIRLNVTAFTSGSATLTILQAGGR